MVIPVLNEERAIGHVLAAVPTWVQSVIVVDNGSTDRTADVARAHGAKVITEVRRGYGSACLAGLAEIGDAEIVVFLDGDFSDHPEEMQQLIAPIVENRADLVIGSRITGRCAPGALTVAQRFGNTVACRLMRFCWNASFTDLGPFRAIRRASLEQLHMDDRGFGWTVQMQTRAARLGLRAVEVPVSYRCRIGRSKISGTLRGVVQAGSKILYTIWNESRQSRRTSTSDRPEDFAALHRQTTERRRHTPSISVVIPALNEQEYVGRAIRSAITADAGEVEIIVVDGGSSDRTVQLARECGATVLRSERGRAQQMNKGAAAGRGEILLFLHADSQLPADFTTQVRRMLAAPDTIAGAFAIAIEPSSAVMRLYAALTHLRSRVVQIPYGDQAIFLTKAAFDRVGGYPDVPIMEDLELARRLQRLGRVRVVNDIVSTSGRRWHRHGVFKTSLLNQLLIIAYYAGVSPATLHRWRESGIILRDAFTPKAGRDSNCGPATTEWIGRVREVGH